MVIFRPMANRIAPASPELTKFYSERHAWRNSGEERMRFRKHMRLAQVRPGSAVLDCRAMSNIRDSTSRPSSPPPTS